MEKCGIYEVRCKVNNKAIVGSSKHLSKRYSQYVYELRRNINKNPYLQRAWNKYGPENFEFVILEECPENELLKKEDEWMKAKQSLNRDFGYNFKPAQRPTHNEETCKKISEGKTGSKNPMYGKILSEEHRNKISRSLLEAKIKRHFSAESRLRMSKSQTGKKLSEETKRKIGEASKIRIFSPESREKMSQWQIGEKSPMWGKHHSEETKLKMSLSHKGKHKLSEEARRAISIRMKENNPMKNREVVSKRLLTISLKGESDNEDKAE